MYTGRKRRFYEIYRKRTVTVNERTQGCRSDPAAVFENGRSACLIGFIGICKIFQIFGSL